MVQQLLGYREHGLNAVPEVLYIGTDGVKLLEVHAAIKAKGFVRLERAQVHRGIPLPIDPHVIGPADGGQVVSHEISKPNRRK